jgi:xylulokinase
MVALLLGIDIGTSSVKAVICDAYGNLVAEASRENRLESPQPGWAEESAEVWWANTVEVIQTCLAQDRVTAHQIAAVGTTGMAPAIVLLDEQGRSLRPAILQNDARAVEEIAGQQRRMDADTFFNMTGATINQQSVGPKLLWVQRHEPEVWAKTKKVIGSYNFITYRLTGEYVSESNWALESGLYDLDTRQWSEMLLRLAGISEEYLPRIAEPSAVVGSVSPEAARTTGLRAGTPVVSGTADHVGAALAAGIQADGDVLIKLGSAGDILYSTDTLLLDPRLYIDYHDIPDKYLLNGCMATSGSLLKWYVEQFCSEDILAARKAGMSLYAYLDARAESLSPGADGLVILPYFLGEKTPILDPQARGVIFGLTLYHTRYHVYRAVLEAIGFGFKHHVQVLHERHRMPRRVVMSEGGARSPLWRQIMADVLNMPITYLAHNPGAALAAAFIAGMGVGVFRSWDEIERFIQVDDVTNPSGDSGAVYEQLFDVYQGLYVNLKETFSRLPRQTEPV